MYVKRLAVVLGAVAMASCSSNPYGTGGGGGGHSTTITVSNNSFTPTPDTVPAGSVTFTWSNASNGHSVTWDSGPDAQTSTLPKTSGSYSPTLVLGTYHYHCSVHPSVMIGTIVVR